MPKKGSGSSSTATAARSTSKSTAATTVSFTYKNGDILLRAGTEAWIQELTSGPYSHAGICFDPAAKKAADAHPIDAHRTSGHEVDDLPISDFYSAAHAPGGGDVFRFTGDKSKAEAAGNWAKGECGNYT